MGKNIFSTTKTLAKNVCGNIRFVLSGEQSVRDAFRHIGGDLRKVRSSLKPSSGDGNRKEALRLVEEGREAYNVKDYPTAEEYFKRATAVDSRCALAYTYLGHTLYKTGRFGDAVAAWNRAIATEPNSDAAAKARRKIQHVERERERFRDQMKERFGKG